MSIFLHFSAPSVWIYRRLWKMGGCITCRPIMDNSKLVATTCSSACGFPHKTSSNTQNIVSAKQPIMNSPTTETELGAFRISGKLYTAEEFKESLPTS